MLIVGVTSTDLGAHDAIQQTHHSCQSRNVQNTPNTCNRQLVFEIFSLEENSLAAAVDDDCLDFDLLARQSEVCSTQWTVRCMWTGYAGKVPPITQQMRHYLKINNNITSIFEQSSEAILTHFSGSLQYFEMTGFKCFSEAFSSCLLSCVFHMAF